MVSYKKIEDLEEFVKRFNSMYLFRRWVHKFIINDCQLYLKDFEDEGMYEYCKEVQYVIDEKIDKMIEGLGFELE